MPSPGVVSTILASIRGYGRVISAILLVGILGSLGGDLAIRYPDQENDPFFEWVYYRYLTMTAVGIIALVLFLMYIFDAAIANGKLRGYLFWPMLFGAVYVAVCVVWEVFIWVKGCNDVRSIGPPVVFENAHCVNRDYPSVTTPDPAFLCTLFGGAVISVGMFIAAYMINQVTCAMLAMRSVRGFGMDTPATGFNTASLNAANENNIYDGDGLYAQIGYSIYTQQAGDELEFGRSSLFSHPSTKTL